MQIDNIRKVGINIKSPNFYGEVIALLDRYSNMFKKRMINVDEKDTLIMIRKMAKTNPKLTEKQKDNIILKTDKLFNIIGYSYQDTSDTIIINDTLIDFSSPILFVNINNFLDNYIYHITKKRITCINNKNELLKLREMINNNYSLTINQKNQLFNKIDWLVELKENKVLNFADFYSDVTSILDSYINLLDKGNKLNDDDKNNLFNIKNKIIKNERLTNNQREQLLIKLNKIMYLAFAKGFSPILDLVEINKHNRLDFDEINNYLIKYTSYLKDNLYKEDLLIALETLLKLNNKIFYQKEFNSDERSIINNRLSFIITNFFDIEVVKKFLKNKINKKEISIEMICRLLKLLKNNYFYELALFFINNEKLDDKLKYDIFDSLSFSLKTQYLNNYMIEILNGNLKEDKFKIFWFIINSEKIFKMININNIKMFENALFNLKKNTDNILVCQVVSRMENVLNEIKSNNVIYDIAYGKIDFERDYKNLMIKMPFSEKDYKVINDKHIITIDEENVQDLDTAFSIEKKDGVYLLSLYVTDVPSVLLENKGLALIAYNNATSYYLHDLGSYSIDMLPKSLSHGLLSLNKDGLKNVITFQFVISNKGEIIDTKVLKNRIIVNHSLDKKRVDDILNSNNNIDIKKDLVMLRDACTLVKRHYNKRYLNIIKDDDLVAFTSILANYYVGENSSIAIYRDRGIYTKENKIYTHSVTPLRRIVSDINLTLFLNDLGLMRVPDKDIYLIEDNIDEIIHHINEREKVGMYVNSHTKVMKKFLKLK